MNLGPVALKSVSCLNKKRNLINIQRRWNVLNFGGPELSESIDSRSSFKKSQTKLTKRGRYVVHTVNVNGMQISPYNSKGILSQMPTG